MKFGEKVRAARINAGLTQDELAQRAGISKRALVNYELNGILPKQKETYLRLATALGIGENMLLDEDATFVVSAAETYGNRGARQAISLVQQITGLYAGGELEDADMDAMMKAIQDAYWIAKEKNRRHVNKRFQVEEDT